MAPAFAPFRSVTTTLILANCTVQNVAAGGAKKHDPLGGLTRNTDGLLLVGIRAGE